MTENYLAEKLQQIICNKPAKVISKRTTLEKIITWWTGEDKKTKEGEVEFLKAWTLWKSDLNKIWVEIVKADYKGLDLWYVIADPNVYKEVWEQVEFKTIREKSYLFEFSQKFLLFSSQDHTADEIRNWFPRISFPYVDLVA